MIILLEDNVMFSVPVTEIARAHGQAVIVAASAAEVLEHLAHPDLLGIVMDMRLSTPDLVAALPASIPAAAFGPHVDGSMFLQMRRLGLRDVWPNSKLREKLPGWLDGLSRTP